MRAEWLGHRLPHENNFDLLRLAAALEVAVYHAAHHLDVQLGWAGYALQQFKGVPIFFFLSGLLVSSSLAGRGGFGTYLERRGRRVLPALWAFTGVALVCLLLFGQLSDALTSLQFWGWLLGQLTLIQVYHPDLFRDYGVGVVNGSLWTIPVEVSFYVVLPALAWLAGRSSRPKLALSLLMTSGAAVSYAAFQYAAVAGGLVAKLLDLTLIPHFWYFALGVLCFLHFEHTQRFVRNYFWPVILAYPVFAFVMKAHIPVFMADALGQLLLAAFVLALGVAAPPVSGATLRGWDVSYGLYIAHMLVVNVMVELGWTGLGAASGAVLASLVLAALSWRFVERPFLRSGGRSAKRASQPLPAIS